MKPAEVRLKIVEDGSCDPYRASLPEEIDEDREETVCVECRHCIDHRHRTSLEWRYECRKAPKYEEHKNFVNGEAMFFDREGWTGILECQAKGWEWALKKKERDYFHSSQSYGSCMKINTEGKCENFERPVDVKKELAKEGRLWPLYARGVAAGALLGLALAWLFN